MDSKIPMCFLHFLVYVLAFDDIQVNGELSPEIIEQGRFQYQLLKERGNLPRYGSCWKGAVQHVDEGCKYLSEETQSDIALHLTNCFLEMSGHEKYNCELDKKPNLRAICISTMTDRAFNVYTEFYTHTQNICWFLRGQIWQETISENTYKVGKQLEASAKNQEELLAKQKESLELQVILSEHGLVLEGILENLAKSSRKHREILEFMTRSMENFQSWIIGEISWFDSIVFYILAVCFCFIFTSIKCTTNARLPILGLLFSNFLVERFICFLLLSKNSFLNSDLLYSDINYFIWYCRYFFVFLIFFHLIFKAYYYKDLMEENNKYLVNIYKQNNEILNKLKLNFSFKDEKIDLINETFSNKLAENSLNNKVYTPNNDNSRILNNFYEAANTNHVTLSNKFLISKRPKLPNSDMNNINARYNLRSKQNTPDRLNL